MKTLIFQGSPHEHGDTAYLTGLLAQRLSGEVRTQKECFHVRFKR